MLVFNTRKSIEDYLNIQQNQNLQVGFVPTMGALHQGHKTLLERSFRENNLTVCSIFVNPLQFNNKQDLEKYPRNIEADIEFIKDCCDVLFIPEYSEIYPEQPAEKFNFGNLDLILEAEFRPGHFYGVAAVVKRFFEIIKPHKAYFGLKDYQQLQIVQSMVKQYQIAVEIISCNIVREDDGLAMSSRNQRLSIDERKIAPLIYQVLQKSSEIIKEKGVSASKEFVFNTFAANKQFRIEYFEWVDVDSFEILSNSTQNMVGLIAVWLGNVRLIDNITISTK